MDQAGPGFHYEYDLYELEASGVKYIPRSYSSKPEEAHFIRKEADGEICQIALSDIHASALHEAVAYLRERGKRQVQYLSSEDEGYLDAPFRAPSRWAAAQQPMRPSDVKR